MCAGTVGACAHLHKGELLGFPQVEDWAAPVGQACRPNIQ